MLVQEGWKSQDPNSNESGKGSHGCRVGRFSSNVLPQRYSSNSTPGKIL